MLIAVNTRTLLKDKTKALAGLRMKTPGEAGKVNISGSTYELVKYLPDRQAGKFKCEHRGKIEAKNKGQIDMYFVEEKT